jgi:hypothetical protein
LLEGGQFSLSAVLRIGKGAGQAAVMSKFEFPAAHPSEENSYQFEEDYPWD